eukprot:Rhum_TRINITY_DN14237_c6_g1::Rhum_TRINITY_DN14237_c6_g1_i1::g.75194::m.75194
MLPLGANRPGGLSSPSASLRTASPWDALARSRSPAAGGATHRPFLPLPRRHPPAASPLPQSPRPQARPSAPPLAQLPPPTLAARGAPAPLLPLVPQPSPPPHPASAPAPGARAPSPPPPSSPVASPRGVRGYSGYVFGATGFAAAAAAAAASPLSQPAGGEAVQRPLIGPCRGARYTFVFDLDETLVFARRGPVVPRPGSHSLLRRLKGHPHVEPVVWTAGEGGYARNILRHIDEEAVVEHLVARCLSWCSGPGAVKDMARLDRHGDRCLLIENTAACVRANPENALLLPDFNHASRETGELMSAVEALLVGLASSSMRVQDYLASSRMLHKATVPCQGGGFVNTYVLTGFEPYSTPAPPAAAVSVMPLPASYRGGMSSPLPSASPLRLSSPVR